MWKFYLKKLRCFQEFFLYLDISCWLLIFINFVANGTILDSLWHLSYFIFFLEYDVIKLSSKLIPCNENCIKSHTLTYYNVMYISFRKLSNNRAPQTWNFMHSERLFALNFSIILFIHLYSVIRQWCNLFSSDAFQMSSIYVHTITNEFNWSMISYDSDECSN